MTTPPWKNWLERVEAGEILPPEAWLPHAEDAPLEELMAAADRVRWRKRPEPYVGYVLDRNVNYSNVCDVVCNFCAFYRKPGDSEGYVLSYEKILEKVRETQALGGSGVLMQGGLHPDLPLEWYEDLLSRIRAETGAYLHCFSPPEIWYFHEHFDVPLEEVLTRLMAAGLQSLPGGGAEILVPEIRKKITTKCTGEQWIEVMRVAHGVGLRSTATMMFGTLDGPAHRLEHMEMIRLLQEETGGFLSFIPWTFQPDNTPLGKAFPDRQPPEVFLRWLALSRLYLQNIDNVQASWLTQGIDVARRGLHGGANDMGSIMIEENVITPAGAKHRAEEADLVEAIRAEGFLPRKRDGGYQWLEEVPSTEGVPDLASPPPEALAV
jgi:cyclic dehypoxanthinyl futalosine synthase